MESRNLLVELLVEELPPKALAKLGEAFARELFDQLKAQGLVAADAACLSFATPRRLAVHVAGVLGKGAAQTVTHKLMPVSVAFRQGVATEAYRKKLAGLGRTHLADKGLDASDGLDRIVIRNDGKTDLVFLLGQAQGVTLKVGLQNAIDVAIARLPIPKVMTYQLDAQSHAELPGWTSVSFVRPVHGLVALHGSEIVPITALGKDAGRITKGHRFESPKPEVSIEHADDYAQTLARDGAVIAGFAARRVDIERQLTAACAQIGSGVQVVQDAALLDEVTALVERPNVLACAFEEQFLEVPQECLILTMKANQKYFPLLDAAGKLTNRFLIVSNISPEDPSAVIGGNERVVRPRLADARFFFDQDRKKTLHSRISQLGRMVYHNKLGSQGDRMERVRAIAMGVATQLGGAALLEAVDLAAQLAKTDLVTDMVGEFPELQGVMGGYYARHDGLGDTVAMAIEDHYKPRFAGDTLARDDAGLALALADKLETLVGLFGIGSLPTGDKDPFALRRHAMGVIRMLVERALPLRPDALVRNAIAVFPAGMLSHDIEPLTQFLIERLKGYLKDCGYSNGEVEAAIHAQGMDTWAELPKRLDAVRAFAALPEALALASANKRISNILKKVPPVDPHVSEVLLAEPAEIALYAAMHQHAPVAAAQFDAGDFAASLQTLAQLRAPVDAFFDGVMVNAPEMDLRLNRQGLLQALHDAMNRVADLSRLDGAGT
ncbi:MAG: glycine--tRNA ligase subunit beta [Burkholderiaceae bacterium]